MTALLVVAVLGILALLAYGLFREPPGRPDPSPATWHPPSRPAARAPAGRRFSGRLVEAEPIAAPPAAQPTRQRMRNGVKVTAVKNGRAVIPPDAIGLGCLQPISECRLGDRCVCLNQSELRMESRL